MTEPTPEERHADVVAAAIFKLWRDSRVMQTEASLLFGSCVTNDAMRVPDDGEVRGFLHGLVRGKLVEPSPALPKPWWREMLDWIAGRTP